MIETSQVRNRRALHFRSLDELTAEVGQIVDRDRRSELVTVGNWSAGEILQHVGKLIEFSLDGFPFQMPWPTRFVCRLLKWVSWRFLLRLAFRPGYRLPEAAGALLPTPGISVDDGAAYLLRQVDRLGRGEKMLQPSPFEGSIRHEQWVEAHLRHAELHFSFIRTSTREGL